MATVPQQQQPQQPSPPSPEYLQMAAWLNALTQPDTATIRQAEAALKPALKQPASMAVLWQIVGSDAREPIAVRHAAAIVLRKRLPGHLHHYPPDEQREWRSQVLRRLAAEPVRPVRAGLAALAAALAQSIPAANAAEGGATTGEDPYAAYLEFLTAAASDANPAARELCFLLLQEMTDTVGHHWKPHCAALRQLFGQVLGNPAEPPQVQTAAVAALGQLLSFWAEDEAEIELLAPLLPTLLRVADRHRNDDDFMVAVLDVLYDLAYAAAPGLQPHLPVTVEFAVSVLADRGLPLRVRDAAALVIATTAEAKPKTLGRNGALLGLVLDALFRLMQDSSGSAAGALFESNPAWRADLVDEQHAQHQQQHGGGGRDDDFSDGEDPDSPTETSMAQGTLDMLACEIPKKYIWPACLQRCLERLAPGGDASGGGGSNHSGGGGAGGSGDPQARKAAVAALGVIAEGCCEPLTANLAHVLPYIFQAARDPDHPQVRECACFALGQISEHCQPDILQYSEQVLPTVFGLLDDASTAVQATSCYVLEMFCERLEPAAVRPVLDRLVRKLAHMLEVTGKRSVQEMAVAALAATAVAAEQEFAPYVAGVAALMQKLMVLREESQFSLRGRALECMGHMAIAVGPDAFRPYFAATMQCAMEGLTLDSTDLQEFAYAVFANLAKVMKEEFAPALPDLVPFLIRVIEQDEGQFEKSDGGGDGAAFGGLDDSDDESANGNLVLHVRTALLEVKKGAITALGEMAAHTGTNFCPHLESSMQVLQKSANNWHPLIKSESAEAFPSLIIPSIAAYHNGEIEWKKGDVTTNNMSPHTAAIVQAVLTEEIALMQDDEKSVVNKACSAVQSVIELCGPQALLPVLNDVLRCTHELLTKTAPCHQAEAMYGEVPDDDDDHDGVMQAACDLVGALGRVLGPQHFAQYLPQFLPHIVEFAKSSRPPNDRSMAVGCLSEIAQEMEGAIAEHWPTVFRPCVLAGLGDEDDNVKRNAAFCSGVCAEHLRDRIAGDVPALLQQLGPIFSLPASQDATAACVDNAAAAVARIIMACPAAVPTAQVLPVMLKALPLKTDMTENETIYTCLLGLLQMHHPDLPAPEVQRIFNEACQESSTVDEEIKVKLREALRTMFAQ